MDERRGVAVFVIAPAIRHVIEVREEPVKLLLRERVVLVVVAPGAAQSQSQPDRGGGLDAVDSVLDLVLVRIRAVLGIAAMVAIEARGDVLRQRWTGEEVARELLDREPVERHVGVERVNHPVAPAPHVPRAVVLIAVSVRVAGRIQPPEGHAFAKARRGQQAFHGLFVSGWRWVGDEVAHRAGGGRESGQIQGDSAQEQRRVGGFRRTHARFAQARQNEPVDRIGCPGGGQGSAIADPAHGFEGPVPRPRGTLRDPRLECLDLFGTQRCVAERGRRHAECRGLAGDPADDLATLRIAADDGEPSVRQRLERPFLAVEAQRRHARGGVRTVTGVAAVGEDRPDVRVEVHGRGGCRHGGRH